MTETEIRAEMGRQGGIARAAAMSKQERKQSAIKANKARWAGHKKAVVTDLQYARAKNGSVKGNSRDKRTARRAAK